MNKYSAIFTISFQQEFAYRMNFIMWRVRNVIQLLVIYFLWDSLFTDNTMVFGYTRGMIMTYVFGVLVLKSLIFSSRSIEVAGEIAQGTLTNYLLKPLSYFLYWFTRDIASKMLNILFVVVEGSLLYFLLKPEIAIQTNVINILLFIFSVLLAVVLYFLLLMLTSMFPFWYPEQAGGLQFLLFIFTDLLGGGVFPLDILPTTFQQIFYLLPFPYLIFAPLQIYLGKVSISHALVYILISFIWVCILTFFLKKVWLLGINSYRGEGR